MREYHYGAGGGAAAAAAAAIANAIKASGAIIKLERDQFIKILAKADSPVIVISETGFFKKKLQYLTCYKGLYFHCTSATPLSLPNKAEIITAKSIWVPA